MSGWIVVDGYLVHTSNIDPDVEFVRVTGQSSDSTDPSKQLRYNGVPVHPEPITWHPVLDLELTDKELFTLPMDGDK